MYVYENVYIYTYIYIDVCTYIYHRSLRSGGSRLRAAKPNRSPT